MISIEYAALFQTNTRVWLTELARSLDHAAVLDDIPDSEQVLELGKIAAVVEVGERARTQEPHSLATVCHPN